jgi:hypothetical protein
MCLNDLAKGYIVGRFKSSDAVSDILVKTGNVDEPTTAVNVLEILA